MIKFKKIIVLKILMVASLFTLPVALSTFIISSGKSPTVEGAPTYVESGLTKFIKKNNDGTPSQMRHIFPDSQTAEMSFKDIYNDVSFDENTKTIMLGNADGSRLEMSDNYYFEHSDAISSSSHFGVDNEKPYETKKFNNEQGAHNCYNWVNGNDNGYSKCLYTVKLISDVFLTKNSSLVLATVLGGFGSGIGASGPVTASNYVNIDLNGHVLTIDSDCTLYNYGHIYDSKFDKNNKHIGVIENYGTILTPFIVDDFGSGARQFAGTACAGTTPFSFYNMPYLSCKVKFHYGSKLKALSSLNASSTLYGANINFIGGNDAFINICDQESFVIKDSYNPFFNEKQIKDQIGFAQNYKAYYYLSGKNNINSLSLGLKLSIAEVNVNMAEYSFPIPPYVHIEVLEDSNIKLPLLLDVYPGATIKTHPSSNIHFSSLKYASIHKGGEKKTSYGGIRVLSQFYPSSGRTMDSNHNNYNVEPYYIYEKNEQTNYNEIDIDGKLNINARVEINSNITQDGDNHILVGRINLGDNTKLNLGQLNNSFMFFTKDIFKYFYIEDNLKLLTYLYSGVSNDEATLASYTFIPLVSQGKVMFDVDSNNYNSFVESNYSFDFSDGVYFNKYTQKYKAYITDNNTRFDVSGSIKDIDLFNEDKHFIVYNNQSYKYFRNVFLQKRIVDNGDLKLKTALNINGDIDVVNNKATGNLVLTNATYEQNIFDVHREKKTTVGKHWLGYWKDPVYPKDWTAIKETNTKTTIKNPTLAFQDCNILNYQDKNGSSFNSIEELNKSIDTFNYVDSNKFSSTINMTSEKIIGKLKISKNIKEYNAEKFTYINNQTTYKLGESETENFVETIKGKERIYTKKWIFKEYSGELTCPQGTFTNNLDLYWQRKPNKFLLTYDNEIGHYVLN